LTTIDFSGPGYVEDLFSCFPTEAETHLTHGDLLPRDMILVESSKVTEILDWETARYHPEFWEYCRMHDPGWMTPAWDCVLGRIFTGPRQAVGKIIRNLHHHNPYMG